MPKEKCGKKVPGLESRELEDYQPGATPDEVMAALKRAAKPTEEPTPRRAKKPEK